MPTKLAHFIHIGKAGGTAIKRALAPFATAGAYQLCLHKHHVVLSDIPAGERVFFVIRDPIERYVSGFNARQRQGRPRYDVPWSHAEAEAFAVFDTADALATAIDASDSELRSQAQIAMRSIGHVRGSYWQWFGDPEYFAGRESDLLAILWLPDLDATFPHLCELLGLSDEVLLPTDDVGSHRSPPTVHRQLSERAQCNLRRWYWPDSEFVRCCKRHRAFLSA
jgi:hypothetical protein